MTPSKPEAAPVDHLRFHRRHAHLAPTFLGAQTVIVVVWMVLNMTGVTHFDAYPFILLNLAFSLQAAYAAPLILLAQTRQAARDKAQSDADAQHREALAVANTERQAQAAQTTKQLLELLEQNTRLTEMTKQLTEHVESLTCELHEHFVRKPQEHP